MKEAELLEMLRNAINKRKINDLDLSIKDKADNSLLHIGAKTLTGSELQTLLTHNEIDRLLRSRGQYKRTLLVSVLVGESEVEEKIKKIKLLISEGENINDQLIWRETILHLAAKQPDSRILKALLENQDLDEVKLDDKNQSEVSPLMIAVDSNAVENANFLIAQGASIHTKDGHQNTILHKGASKLSTKDVEKLLEHDGIEALLSQKNEKGQTPISVAVEHKKEEIVAHFVEKIGINQVLMNESVDLLGDLLKMGCVKACFGKDHKGEGRLIEAFVLEEEKTVEVFIKSDIAKKYRGSMGQTALHVAAKFCDNIALKALLEEPGIKKMINHGDQKGLTPLVWAIKGEKIENIQLLLESGASVKNVGRSDSNALYYAASHLSKDDLKTLLVYSNIEELLNESDRIGSTPIQGAIRNNKCGNVALLKNMLVEKGVDLTKVVDESEENLLHEAATHGSLEMVQVVLEIPGMNDKINTRSDSGMKALTLAVRSRNMAIAKYLRPYTEISRWDQIIMFLDKPGYQLGVMFENPISFMVGFVGYVFEIFKALFFVPLFYVIKFCEMLPDFYHGMPAILREMNQLKAKDMQPTKQVEELDTEDESTNQQSTTVREAQESARGMKND